jgi:hypothetical protein
MRRVFIFFLLIAVLVAPVPANYAQDGTNKSTSKKLALSSSRSAAEGITAAQLRDYLYFVASDEMEGRDTPSRGLNITAKFIATLLARWGVKPAGDDGTYFQKIAMDRSRIDAAGTRAEINNQPYKYGADFLAIPRSGTATGSLVYVGHGWIIKSKNIDAYRGIDVKNKIIVLSGERYPKGVTPGELDENKRGEDWVQPRDYAKKMGALGVVSLPSVQGLDRWDRVLRRQLAGGSLSVTKLDDVPRGSLPDITLAPKMADALFQGEKHSSDEILKSMSGSSPVEAFELDPAKRLSLTISGQDESLNTQNVVGLIEGGDRNLKNEYVAIGAHYDHVGTGPAGSNGRGPSRDGSTSDTIYNGADDDGSGTVTLLAMAEALARGPRRPKRSVLFVWHCGEEKGLWGSEYFATYPTVPIDRIVAQFNIDMIGRSKKEGDTSAPNRALTGPNEIYVIGSKMMSTQLGELSERVNRSYLNLSFNYLYDNPTDPNRFFFRSDHYNYAQKGIPIIFYFDGVHEDYHRPGDEPQKIDYDKMQRVARTIFVTMWETADLKARPVVDKKLPSELSER